MNDFVASAPSRAAARKVFRVFRVRVEREGLARGIGERMESKIFQPNENRNSRPFLLALNPGLSTV
jgi:hypothetical protein